MDETYFTYTYSGTVTGNYSLYINNTLIRNDINISELNRQYTLQIPLNEVYNNTNIGSNYTVSELRHNSDSSISIKIYDYVVITSNDIVISSNLSQNSQDGTPISKNANI